ncbi:murein biosynthesis integral membrane protein MurJ [Paraclostridium bifermentans]|uniref:murein biosynthesis integral membrane protein MurJ n=1 Tax=Paraclostridium bifermentans TaxID=1490 RepID=UPI00115BC5F7|nr:murein biosynthesis integral membrane protein MurJ [Paraclostridium bifermentans]TQO58816.1 murein biosynthesis integral membrane protein MurJ [Paraclostridium bifermentans]GKZ01609.1 putative lipid II flippase MurJ [Paraclostridium bifermentans]GKZ07866.1 putative lipid II flippase MurJ [Paraclostridium bifermentans]GKZ10851.1 putative lipid II flippase MurJ [Paraclostridium bifermentans]
MSNLAKSAFWLMVVTMLSKVLGFGREIILGYFYGTSAYSDVYIVAMNIPLVVFSSIGVALVTTFIPLYQEALTSKGEERALKFSNNVMSIVVILSIILGVLGFVFAEPLVKLFAMHYTGEKLELAVKFVRIMIGGVVFIGLSNLMTSYLQIKGDFTIPGMIGFPNNIIIITSIILSAVTGNIYILAIGTLIGMLSQFLFQVPFAIKKGYKFKPTIDFKDEYLKKMLWLVMPVLIGVAVNQINAMVDRSLASGLEDGVITALNNANRLNGFVMGMFIATLGAVIYPTLSKLSTENNKEKFAESVANSVNCVNLLVVPASVGAMILATPVVRILFERGAFNDRSTMLTATALVFYSVGMVGFGLRDILGKVFYSLKDTKTPMINGIIAVVLNIVLNIALVKVMGHGGLALATSLSAIICIILLFISLKKKIGYYGQDKIKSTFIKTVVASLVMGVVTYFVYKFLFGILGLGFIQEAISLGVSIAIGGAIYLALIIVFKVEEVNMAIDMIKKKLKR